MDLSFLELVIYDGGLAGLSSFLVACQASLLPLWKGLALISTPIEKGL